MSKSLIEDQAYRERRIAKVIISEALIEQLLLGNCLPVSSTTMPKDMNIIYLDASVESGGILTALVSSMTFEVVQEDGPIPEFVPVYEIDLEMQMIRNRRTDVPSLNRINHELP